MESMEWFKGTSTGNHAVYLQIIKEFCAILSLLNREIYSVTMISGPIFLGENNKFVLRKTG
jgi:hypothetical protein